MSREKLNRHAWIALGLFLTLAAGAFASENEESGPPPNLLEQMEKEMLRARGMITNAEARLRNKIQGVGGGTGEEAPTPAMACCSKNIEKLRFAVAELARIHEELGGCYRTEGLLEGETALQLANQDLGLLARTVEAFARSKSPSRTRAGLAGMTRAFLLLRDSSDELPPCPPEEGGSDPGSGGGETGSGTGSAGGR